MEIEGEAKDVVSVWGGKICTIPYLTSGFGLVNLKEKVEFKRFFQIDRLNSTVSSK